VGDEKTILNQIILKISGAIRQANRHGMEFTQTDVTEVLHNLLDQAGIGPIYNTPAQVIERVRQIEEAPDPASAVAVNFAQGATFRLLDDVVGLFSEGTKEEMRRIQEASYREGPWYTNILPEIAGGFATPGLAASGTVRAGGSLLRAAGAAAATGAVEGGIAGFGTAEGSPQERLPSTLKGALYGGAAGALLGGAGYGLKKGYRYMTGRTGLSVEDEARRFAQNAANESPRGVEGVLEDLGRMQEATPTATLADVPEMRPLARGAGAASRNARERFRAVMTPRAREAYDRIDGYLARALQDTDVPETVLGRRKLLAQRFAEGQQAYRQLEETVQNVMTPELGEALTNERVWRAWSRANRELTDSGQEGLRQIIRKEGNRVVLTGEQADFRTLQAIKFGLDDAVGAASGSRQKGAAAVRAKLRDQYSTAMDNAITGFGDAQDQWYRMSQEVRAITDGSTFLRKTADQVREDLSHITDPQVMDAYRLSAAEQLSEEVRRKARRADPTSARNAQVLNPSQDMEDKLELLFGDEDGFVRFLNEIDTEREMMISARGLRGGEEGQAVDIVGTLQRAGPGAEEMQRMSIIPVAPGIGAARLAADAARSGITRRAVRRGEEVGGLLAGRMTGSAADASNLLRGAITPGRPGLGSFGLFRSPAALYMALTAGSGSGGSH